MNQPQPQGPLSRRLPRQPEPRIPEWRRRAQLPANDPERIGMKDTTSLVLS